MYFNRLLLNDIVDFSQKLGINKKVFEPLWDRIKVDEDNTVDYDSVVHFIKMAVEQTKDNYFGLHLGEFTALKATKSVDQIMEKSLTIEEAFFNAVQYSKLISDSMICSLKKEKDSFSVIFEYHPDWKLRPDLAKKHNLDAALVSAVKAIRLLIGSKFYPQEVRFAYPKPRHINEYYRVFNCSLYFNQARAEIIFQKNLLHQNIPSSDFGLLQKLKSNAETQLQQLKDEDSFILKIKQHLLKSLENNRFPDVITLSEGLNLTPRTLQRRLKSKNTSFSSLLTEIKLQLAIKHLRDDKLKTEEVAFLLGYSEASAFIRAFKKEKGLSPKAFVK